MDSGRATVRNMRSKCRCSYVLQFTFRRAVCCVLHRPPSQVIHCTVLLMQKQLTKNWPKLSSDGFKASHGGEQRKNQREGRSALSGIVPIERSIGVPHPTLWPPAGHECIEATWPRMRPAHAFSRQQTGRQLKAMKPEVFFQNLSLSRKEFDNDPSAGSPTETLLRLLLPLNAQVWESSRATLENESSKGPVQIPH